MRSPALNSLQAGEIKPYKVGAREPNNRNSVWRLYDSALSALSGSKFSLFSREAGVLRPFPSRRARTPLSSSPSGLPPR